MIARESRRKSSATLRCVNVYCEERNGRYFLKRGLEFCPVTPCFLRRCALGVLSGAKHLVQLPVFEDPSLLRSPFILAASLISGLEEGDRFSALGHLICILLLCARPAEEPRPVTDGAVSSVSSVEELAEVFRSLGFWDILSRAVTYGGKTGSFVTLLRAYGPVGREALERLGLQQVAPTEQGSPAAAEGRIQQQEGRPAVDGEADEVCGVCYSPGEDGDPLLFPVAAVETRGRFETSGDFLTLRGCIHKVHRDCFRPGAAGNIPSCPVCRQLRQRLLDPEAWDPQLVASTLCERTAIYEVRLRSVANALGDERLVPILKILTNSLRGKNVAGIFPPTPLGRFVERLVATGVHNFREIATFLRADDRFVFARRALIVELALEDRLDKWGELSSPSALTERFGMDIVQGELRSWLPMELPNDFFRLSIGRPGFGLAHAKTGMSLTTGNVFSLEISPPDDRPDLILGLGTYATRAYVWVPELSLITRVPGFYLTELGEDGGLVSGELPTLSAEQYAKTVDMFMSGSYIDRIS